MGLNITKVNIFKQNETLIALENACLLDWDGW